MASAPVRGVLFDLDGTLLDLDLHAFLRRYFGALQGVLAELAGPDGARRAMDAVLDATEAMAVPHDGLTNQCVFERRFNEMTGLDIVAAAPLLDTFYEDIFPGLRGESGPAPGGREAMQAALGLGLRVAVATNPIFPRRAIEHRMRWAGIGDLAPHVVTSYETSTACKPHGAYFREVAAALGVAPHECVMVGDDAMLDMAAADVGMRTYYVGSGTAEADYAGDLDAFADLLPRLVGD